MTRLPHRSIDSVTLLQLDPCCNRNGCDSLVGFAEHFGLEPIDLRAVLPGVFWQSGLVTRVREKHLRVPVPLGRDLRQQQATLPALLDNETVTADFDVAR